MIKQQSRHSRTQIKVMAFRGDHSTLVDLPVILNNLIKVGKLRNKKISLLASEMSSSPIYAVLCCP